MPIFGCVTVDQKELLFFDIPLKIKLLTADFKTKEKYVLDFGQDNPIIQIEGQHSMEIATENMMKRASIAGAIRDIENALYFDVICAESLYLVKYDKKTGAVTTYRIYQNDKPIIGINSNFSDNRYNYIRTTENGMILNVVTIKE